ncbi:MAG: hypothetical protein R3F37_13925 [Candidatus Competibacteraceae bacterium]
MRGSFQIVELSGFDRPDQGPRHNPYKSQRYRQQQKQDFHVVRRNK